MSDFEEVYRLYYKAVYLYVLGVSGNEAIAEDITADTFLKAMKSSDKFRGTCDIRVWLCQIAKNTFYNYCKKHNKVINNDEIFEAVPDDFHIEEEFTDEESAMKIHMLLHNMEEPYKEVFTLRVFGELSFKKIGEIFGKTESWARVTYYRSKLKLIDKMEGIK